MNTPSNPHPESSREDTELRRLFAAQRAGDEPRTPAFSRLWAGAAEQLVEKREKKAVWPGVPAWAMAGALAAVLAAGTLTLWFIHRSASAEEELWKTAEAIAAWQAPTETFLAAGLEEEEETPLLASGGEARMTGFSLETWEAPTAFLLFPPPAWNGNGNNN